MITNFKIFEKEGDKFSIGTWVLLEYDPEHLWNVYPYVKIIDKESTKTHNDPDETPLNDYEIETFSLLQTRIGEIITFWINDYEIERKLTQNEIDQTKAKLDAIKYNI